jgi:hypothetical protein
MTSQIAWGQETHRELGPHVHGHGVLNIAIENTRVAIELDVPGMDILGFEHEPATAEQKEAVKAGEAQLGKALELFKLPQAAACTAVEGKVGIEADHDHETPAGTSEPPAGGAHEGHRDYNANYVLECAHPDAIKQITFDYFKHFKGAHGLTVNIVSDKSQNSYEVTSEKPVLDLGGTM